MLDGRFDPAFHAIFLSQDSAAATPSSPPLRPTNVIARLAAALGMSRR